MTHSFMEHGALRGILMLTALAIVLLCVAGCGAINPGKPQPIVRTSPDEEYWHAKDVFLTAGSAYNQRDAFDHNMHESVKVFFTPRHETNTYVAETIWQDPSGQEFRTIRTSYDKQRETAKGEERAEAGTRRVHSIPAKDLFQHKPGSWKVALKLDSKLVRKLDFTIR